MNKWLYPLLFWLATSALFIVAGKLLVAKHRGAFKVSRVLGLLSSSLLLAMPFFALLLTTDLNVPTALFLYYLGLGAAWMIWRFRLSNRITGTNHWQR